MRVKGVISGGQTGADQAGLRAAKKLGIGTGGFAPKEWRTEDGRGETILAEFDLMESDSYNYEDITEKNVTLADGTVIFGKRSQGSNLTEELCRKFGKPCCWIMWPQNPKINCGIINPGGTYFPTINASNGFHFWLKNNGIQFLNCSGNRESKNPGIGAFTEQFLMSGLK